MTRNLEQKGTKFKDVIFDVSRILIKSYSRKKYLGGKKANDIVLWVVGADISHIIWVIGVRKNLITWVVGFYQKISY